MIENMFDSYAMAIRPAVGQDSAGGNTQDFTPGHPGVTVLWQNRPCSYQEAHGSVVFKFAQRNTLVSNTLYFTLDPGDLTNCLLIVTRPQSGDTIKLTYKGASDPVQNGADWVYPVVCERWRTPK